MKRMNMLAASTAAIALSAGLATTVNAQSITSTVRGAVTSNSGAPIAGASVTITDSRTGTTRSATTGGNGQFNFQNLEVGGPYIVSVVSSDFQGERVDDLFVNLADTTTLSFSLDPASSGDEIIVVASRSVQSDLASGPSALFNTETLEAFPSVGRDFRDVIRIDPRVRIDGTNDDAVQCVGGNNRFNSFTVDGVRNGDAFGLNASGLVSRFGIPIPFDSIRETSVEFAPFDVEYGQFTGCNINVVTKSGTNEFSGAAFAAFSSQSLTGSTIDDNLVSAAPFRDYNWGASVGGPVFKDKLFFFVAYEETKDNRIQSTGPAGGGFGQELGFVTVDQANQIEQALAARGIEAGGILSTLPRESRRILTRWDWNITDDHRLAFTYQRQREAQTNSDDFSAAANSRTFAYGGNFFLQGSETETYSARLFSQWTDNLSTEIRASRADISDIQDPVGGGEAQNGNPIPRVLIGVSNDANGNSIIETNETGAVIAGPGFSRAANGGVFQVDQIKAKADYVAGDHTFSFGYELDQLDAFNVFAQNGTGTLAFANLAAFNAGNLLTGGTNTFINGASINGAAGSARAAGATVNASFTGDINDAAAIFSRSQHSIYAQDEWQVTDALTAVVGLRYDFYKSGSRPILNPRFVSRYGFDNQQAYQGLSAFLPRLGLTYEADETLFGTTTFRLGAGVFSGGDPTVWFSNVFSNPGTTLSGPNQSISGAGTSCVPADFNVGTTGALTVPQCLVNDAIAAAQAADGRVDAVDPDYKLPTVIRGNFGFTHNTDFGGVAGGFFDDWTIQADALYSAYRNSVDFVDISIQQVSTAVDGRPNFSIIDPLRVGCTATLIGVREGWANVTPACILTSSSPQGAQDTIVLTNALEGTRQLTISTFFSKTYDYDLLVLRNGEFGLSFGYAFTDAEDIQPGTSSVSTSNYGNVARANFNNDPLATSNYETRHNVTMAATFAQDIIADLRTKVGIFFQARSGQPYSLTFNNASAFGDTASGEQRSLLYIPTGPTDPNVVFGPSFNTAGFFAFLEEIGADEFAGQIAPRNAFQSQWFYDLDMRFEQELPLPIRGLQPTFYVDIDNVLNLVNDGSNVLRQVPFGSSGYQAEVVTLGNANPGTAPFQYNAFSATAFSTLTPASLQSLQEPFFNESLWQVQFGLRFEF